MQNSFKNQECTIILCKLQITDYLSMTSWNANPLDTMKQEAELIPYTVTQINREVRSWLEYELGVIAVTGELSNLSRPASGHLYFTLKDEQAQLRCAFFRNAHTEDTRQFVDGQQVIAFGKLSVYEARGDYQLIVQKLTSLGVGALYQQFEKLKQSLEKQGLFAAERKRSLPKFPQIIAVITSKSGAALQDILTTLKRRYPIAEVHIYPSEVQGAEASKTLIQAIVKANQDNQAEVILLARGGGSMEDLWSFNDEQLALAINASRIPIISGVGHETDFTIADFVADLRAATPTAAAQAATPDQVALLQWIETCMQRLNIAAAKIIRHQQLVLSHYTANISSPNAVILKYWQSLDYLERQLHQAVAKTVQREHHQLQVLMLKLEAKNPQSEVARVRLRLAQISQQIERCMAFRLQESKQGLLKLISSLETLSPLATLSRGYAIATSRQKVLTDADAVQIGDKVDVRLLRGVLQCAVLSKGDINA